MCVCVLDMPCRTMGRFALRFYLIKIVHLAEDFVHFDDVGVVKHLDDGDFLEHHVALFLGEVSQFDEL